jgi:dienelactone hydrolase
MLDGALVGTGSDGVVLLHEYPGPMCGWWPYATYLAHHGMRALLFDFRCLGLSACGKGGYANPVADVAGAMAALRSRGARSISLVGASFGGTAAVIAGAKLGPSAIVDLSGERDLTGLVPGARLNAYASAPSLRAPAMFAVARDDRYTSIPDTHAVYDRTASRAKRLVVLSAGAGHGWDMLTGTNGGWAHLAAQILEFIRVHATRR